MLPHPQPDPIGDQGQNYCQQLHSMRDEMSASMLAISSNSLHAFEESLRRQEVLCLSLTRLLQVVGGTEADTSALVSIRSATTALHRLNKTYSELVQQSRVSGELMYALCRSYTDSRIRDAREESHPRCSFEA